MQAPGVMPRKTCQNPLVLSAYDEATLPLPPQGFRANSALDAGLRTAIRCKSLLSNWLCQWHQAFDINRPHTMACDALLSLSSPRRGGPILQILQFLGDSSKALKIRQLFDVQFVVAYPQGVQQVRPTPLALLASFPVVFARGARGATGGRPFS